MKTPMLAAIAPALLAAACLDTNDSVPDVYPTEMPPAGFYPGGEFPGDGQLTLAGHLEGSLRGVALSGDTTDNYGSFADDSGSPAYLSASIAARGSNGGAGMLIINLTEPGLREKLLGGQWSGSSDTTADGETYSSVSSCAGPAIGDWPYEIGSVDYQMDATEDPGQPGTVVLAVKAHFPRSESDSSSTTELTGTLRFELPASSD